MSAFDAVDGSRHWHLGANIAVAVEEPPTGREPSIKKLPQSGLISRRTVFQIHGVDASGRKWLVRRQPRRSQVLPFFGEAKLPVPCRH